MLSWNDLNSLTELHREKKRIEDRIEQLRASATRTSPQLDGMPHGSVHRDIMAEYAANYDEAMRHLSAVEARLAERIDRIELEIRSAHMTPQETAVIWTRFAEGKTIGQTAHELHYSRSGTYKIYKKGLDSLLRKEWTHLDTDP